MKLLWFDQGKKLIRKPFYLLTLSLIMFTVIGSFTLIRSMVVRLEAPVADYYEAQNIEDFSIVLGQIDFALLNDTQRAAVCALYPIHLCAGLDERDPVQLARVTETIQRSIYQYPQVYDLVFDPLIGSLSADYDLLFEKSVGASVEDQGLIYRFISIHNIINKPLITEGRLPENPQEAAIYQSFAKAHNLQIGDVFDVRGRTFTLTGFFFAPEHTSPMILANELNFDSATQTLVLVEEQVIYNLRVPFTVKYMGKGDFQSLYSEFDISNILTAELRTFGKNMQMVQAVVPAAFNIRIVAIETETNTATTFTSLFLGIFAVFSLTVLIVFIKRHLDSQTRDMTILHALGYGAHRRAMALVLIGVWLALVAIIAFTIGLALSHRFFLVYAERYQMPLATFFIPRDVLIAAGLGPLVVLPLLTYGYTRWLFWIQSKPNSTWALKRQSWIRYATQGGLFLLISILLVFSLSSRSIIDDFKSTTLRGNNYENMVFLTRFTTDTRANTEPFSSGVLTVTTHQGIILSTPYRVQGYGFDEQVTLKRLIDDDPDKNQLLNSGAIVTHQAASLYGFSLGDTLTIRVGLRTHQTSIVAINDNLIEAAIFLNQTDFNRLYGLRDTYFNGYFTNRETIRDPDAFRILNYRAIAEEIDLLFHLSAQIATAMMTLAIGLSLLFFVFLMQQALDEQRGVFLTLRALGYTSAETYRLFFLKTIVILLGAFAVAVWVSSLLIESALRYLQTTLGFVFVLQSRPLWILFAFVLVAGLVGLCTWLVHQRALRIPLVDILKQDH